jgi:arylsulfatase A-like enzyme
LIYRDDEYVAGELGFGRWIRRGHFKAASVPEPYGSGNWELYNLTADPGETTNLAGAQPGLLRELTDAWHAYAADVGVVSPD